MTSKNTKPIDLDALDPDTRAIVEKFIDAEPIRRRPVPKTVGHKAKTAPAIPQMPRQYKDAKTRREALKAGHEARDAWYQRRKTARDQQRRLDQGLPPLPPQA